MTNKLDVENLGLEALFICPNCGRKTEKNLRCKNCGLGKGDEYYNKKVEEETLKKIDNLLISEKLKGNGKKIDFKEEIKLLKEINGKKISKKYKVSFYNYHGRIKENEAEIEVRIGNGRLKFFLEYDIQNVINARHGNGDNEGTGKAFVNEKIIKIEKKEGKEWKDYPFKLKENKDIIKKYITRNILLDYNLCPNFTENN